MKPVKVVTAVAAGVLVTALSGLVMQLLRNSGGALPRHSWWEVLLVAALCAALGAGGWRVRDQVRTRTRAKREADAALRAGQDEPQARAAAADVMRGHEGVAADTARRVVVFAQAAAVGGAVLAGWYLGQALVHLGRFHVASARASLLVLGFLAASAVALSALGFLVQRWCMIPDDER